MKNLEVLSFVEFLVILKPETYDSFITTHRGLGRLVGEHGWEPPIPGSNPLYYGLTSLMGHSKCGPDAVI
ncbi:hypothetical protein M5K25_011345 [Dendrobium thyrsiflorum]|uniref:Uncharacterized protein n=1 Tax=Dendrobium thyrsiflorum TaxID=117978 RepID=A0ABD0V2S3_DENTH